MFGDVVAIVWPSQEELAKLRQGEAVPTLPVTAVRSAASGAFSIHLDPSSLPERYRGDKGQIDVQLIAGDSQTEMEWNFSARPQSETQRWAGVDTSPKALPAANAGAALLRMDLQSGRVTNSLDDPSTWRDAKNQPLTVGTVQQHSRAATRPRSSQIESALATIQRRSVGSMAGLAVPTDICIYSAGAIYYHRPEYFLKAYAWSGAMATVSQSYGVDHKLGIGLKSYSGWTSSGTSTISLNASGSRGGVADATVFNAVNYRDYNNSCSAFTTRKPYGVYAMLTNYTYAPHVNFTACTRYTGGTYSKVQGVNVTYGSGVDISGFSVSAQSGHNSESKISWTVTRGTRLCGSSSVGWVSSSQAEAHSG